MKYNKTFMMHFALLLAVLMACMMIPDASATVITTFNNSLISENLTFTGNQNITRYLSVPSTISYFTEGYLNLSGYGYNSTSFDFGNGADGELIFTSGTKSYGNLINNIDYTNTSNTLYFMTNRIYQFTNFTLGSGMILSTQNITGTAIVIKSLNQIIIQGNITLAGVLSNGNLSNSIIVDGINYNVPGVAGINSGFGSGGRGGSTNVYTFNPGGSGGNGGTPGGNGGSSQSCSPSQGKDGQNGGISSGGSGACGVLSGNSANSGAGGNAYNNNGGDGSCSAGGSPTPVAGGGGGGGSGGNAGISGLHLIIESNNIVFTGLINVSGTSGGNGGSGGNAAHCGYSGSGITRGGVGGDGGGGGNAGNIIFKSISLTDYGIKIMPKGTAGNGGNGGESRNLNNVNAGYESNGSIGMNGTDGLFYHYYPKNVSLKIGNSQIWNYSGVFTNTNNKTNSFASILNPYLNLTYLVGSNYIIPFTFHSDTPGILQYSGININDESIWNISICGANNNVSVINFTTKYELDNSIITNSNFQGTFIIWLNNILNNKTITVNALNDADGRFDLCTNSALLQLKTNAFIQYDKADYSTRNYFLNNFTLSNNTQFIDLYLMNSTLTTDVIARVLDASLFVQPNVIVKVLRYYPGTDTWNLVEEGKTDDLGQAIIHLVEKSVDYKFIFEKNGKVLYNTNPMKIACLQTPCQIEFVLPSEYESVFTSLADVSGLTSSLTYDNNTKIISFTWNDASGASPTMRLYVRNMNMSNSQGYAVICNSTLAANSGTLLCDISAYNSGTILAQGYRTASPSKLINQISILLDEIWKTFGKDGLLWTFMLVLVLFMVGLWNPAVAIVLGLTGFALMTLLGIIALSWMILLSIIIIGVIIIINLKT